VSKTQLKKVVSLFLALAMMASMFVCLSTLNAFAAVDITQGPSNDDPTVMMAAQTTTDADRCALTSYDFNWLRLTYYQEVNLKAGQE